MVPANVDLTPLGIIGGLVGVIVPIITVIVSVVKSRTDTSRAQTEIYDLSVKAARDAVRDIKTDVDELRAARTVDNFKIETLTHGFTALYQILERSRGHALATPDEQQRIDAARALIE